MSPVVRTIEEGMYEIEEMGFVSAYLIVGGEKSVMIDTGFGVSDFSEIASRYTDHEVLVINTHIHPDHSNGNRYFSNTSMALREWENHGLKWNKATKNIIGGSWDPAAMFAIVKIKESLPEDFSHEDYNAFVARGIPEPDMLWNGDEIIDLGGRILEIIPTPAHTTGSISILERESGAFFMGDAFAKGSAWYLHLKCKATLEDTYATFQHLASISDRINKLYPSHGEKGVDGHILKEVDERMTAVRNGDISGEELDHLTGKAVYFDFGGYGPFMPPEVHAIT